MRAFAAVMAIAVAALAACSSPESAPAPELPHDLAGKVTTDGMATHLRKLQEIADANRGSRAEGTPGYDASVDYVVQVLKDKGFDVQTPEFERLDHTAHRAAGKRGVAHERTKFRDMLRVHRKCRASKFRICRT